MRFPLSKKNLGVTLVISTLAIACSPSQPKATVPATKSIDRQVVIDFADKVVVPSYERFTAKTKDLKIAVDAFTASPTAATLKSAQQAWMDARVPWEKGESFTIGPAKSLGLDGSIDTWPLNKTDVDKVLKGSEKLTPESVTKLQDSQKGYHTIEFLLFGGNGKKVAADFTPRDLEYVKAATTVLDRDANSLLNAWTRGVDGKPAYREVFTTAGEPSNTTYPTLQAAAQEMVEGILDSTTEVAENKIGEPFTKKDVTSIESQYAIANPLKDFKSNILCVKNVYFGTLEDHASGKAGLSAFVAKIDPKLDARVDQEINAALASIEAIPAPFHNAITDPSAATKIQSAIAAVTTVKETFEKDIKPLVLQ